MKVKLLDPPAGYEDVAEYRAANVGEKYINCDGKISTAGYYDQIRRLVITPKPLPTIEPPKWLGVVEHGKVNYLVAGVARMYPDRWIVSVVSSDGSDARAFMIGQERMTLIHTANIPTAPELEALFKERQ